MVDSSGDERQFAGQEQTVASVGFGTLGLFARVITRTEKADYGLADASDRIRASMSGQLTLRFDVEH
jgi:hypothetical protein